MGAGLVAAAASTRGEPRNGRLLYTGWNRGAVQNENPERSWQRMPTCDGSGCNKNISWKVTNTGLTVGTAEVAKFTYVEMARPSMPY